MIMEICIYVRDNFKTYKACANLADQNFFERLKICDDPMLAIATGEYLDGSAAVEEIRRLRKDTAKLLGAEIAALIVKYMEANDTYNGYKKGD
jgi:hypothetical protein